MEVMIERCCGLDIHQKNVVACTLVGKLTTNRPKKELATFGTTTTDLRELVDWLKDQHITTVLMESTGQYWRPVWSILDGNGMRLMLANPQHIKNVPGRKTDVNDAEWIAQLGRFGLVQASYIPSKECQELRDMTRLRKELREETTKHKNEIHDILQYANIKLTSFLSDIFGASGKKLLALLIEGVVLTEEVVTEVIDKRVKESVTDLVASMNGNLTKGHRQLLDCHFTIMATLEQEISKLDTQIDEHAQQ